jgi:probable rRNA maturation factor
MSENRQPPARSDLPGTGISRPEGAQVSVDPGSDYLITVQIDTQYESQLDADALHRLAIRVLQSERVAGPLEMGVVITTDEEVRTLNRQYLEHDYETDVISFGMGQGDTELTEGSRFVTPAERPPYLGDVVISCDRATEQAPEYGHTTQAEVATLLVHGVLHLLGYDDTSESDRERMHARQQELISDFGL